MTHQIKQTMNLIREVLVDRQLSFNQADLLIGQKYLADIFKESASALEDDFASKEQDAIDTSPVIVAPTEQDAISPSPIVTR